MLLRRQAAPTAFPLIRNSAHWAQRNVFTRRKTRNILRGTMGISATLTEQNGKAGVALFDTTVQPPTLLDVRLDEQATACWLGWLDGLLYCANYHDGHLLIYEVENRRAAASPTDIRAGRGRLPSGDPAKRENPVAVPLSGSGADLLRRTGDSARAGALFGQREAALATAFSVPTAHGSIC